MFITLNLQAYCNPFSHTYKYKIMSLGMMQIFIYNIFPKDMIQILINSEFLTIMNIFPSGLAIVPQDLAIYGQLII